ncbi:serine/threonine-protein kinase [Stieleria varia]|uniref:non-specific serine/threonine protein kinase n=1 Tax=Stieleria varia TaxID=2528005 RepID=A0A5C6ANT3_9BACT|nr:serine/threonine-protein kinase [Stieleria varia]TWU01178.1 Serine/threonine-protein kinase PrkC [Stieleria varia]
MTDTPQDDRVDEAFAAYLRCCDAGELESREDFLAQFPDIAGELKELMEAADGLGRFASGHSTAQAIMPQPGADTVSAFAGNLEDSGGDPALTLPEASRAKGDPGPTLPFRLGDEYELQEVIGRGGMGVVYKAKQFLLNRIVAVKMIRGGMLADENDVRRFYTEAQAAARLNHHGIVAVHQFGKHDHHHFFSMEYIRGTDLQRRINSEQLSLHDSARYVRDVARAISHAHLNSVLHRDLKPANVLIDDDDQIHVTDFGLAKHLGTDSSVTGSGAAVGTPNYMAPEQAGGHSDRASKQSDIYSLGAILFACVTGRPPIMGDSIVETLLHVVHEKAPPMRSLRADVPIDLETIVAKCLEKSPEKRYGSADDLAEDLDAFMEGRPINARPRSRAMKSWDWLQAVPLIAALTGRRVIRTSVMHRRFQAVMLLMFLVSPLILVMGLRVMKHRQNVMPGQVHIAGGVERGAYSEFSVRLSDRLKSDYAVESFVSDSGGSVDNRTRLISGEVDLAPMQASMVSGDPLCVVAPLFYEAVHVLVRQDSQINSAADLRGHRVAVGPAHSGSLGTAQILLDSLGLSKEEAPQVIMPWPDLLRDDAPDAAIICVGLGSSFVAELMQEHQWKLMTVPSSLSIAREHPTLRTLTITQDDYPNASIPTEGIPTVATTAFLAARRDAPSELVTAALEMIYREPQIFVGLIPRQSAAEWQGLAFHPAARLYFSQTPTTTK